MQGGKEALDAAGIEIPFPHQVAVPYGDADKLVVAVDSDTPRLGRAGSGAGEEAVEE